MDYNRRRDRMSLSTNSKIYGGGGDVTNKLESQYQGEVKKRLEARFPGCLILKNDEQLIQGIFDLTMLYGRFYVALEVKRDATAPKQPNQDYYIDLIVQQGGMAAFIYPEIEEEVLDALQQSFEAHG